MVVPFVHGCVAWLVWVGGSAGPGGATNARSTGGVCGGGPSGGEHVDDPGARAEHGGRAIACVHVHRTLLSAPGRTGRQRASPIRVTRSKEVSRVLRIHSMATS